MCKIWSFEEKKYKLLVNVVEFKIKLKKSFCTCDAHNDGYLLRATFPFYLTANNWQNQKRVFLSGHRNEIHRQEKASL